MTRLIIGLCMVFLVGFVSSNDVVDRVGRWTPHPYQLQVRYDMFLEFDGYRVFRAELYTGSSGALFSFRAEQLQTGVPPVEIDSDEFEFELIDTATYFIVSDRTSGLIHQLERLPATQDFCVVTEPEVGISWRLTGRTKMIDTFECQEATGVFGGRDYTVWYSDQFPLSFGPWKLHGLPGMVLEAYDASRQVRFVARAIKRIGEQDSVPTPDIQGYQTFDRVQYNERLRSYLDGLERRIISRFDRSFRVKVSSSPIQSVEIHHD